MRHVDLDLHAARSAAAACRAGAHELRELAPRIVASIDGADWFGGDARAAHDAACLLADSLRVEASSLDATADDIDAGIASATRAEFRRHEAALARAREAARRAEVCVPTAAQPTWSHP